MKVFGSSASSYFTISVTVSILSPVIVSDCIVSVHCAEEHVSFLNLGGAGPHGFP